MENLFNRTWAEVDIDNILHNVRVIKDTLTGNSKIIAVVKADAYGHGAVAVAKALEKETVRLFSVPRIQRRNRQLRRLRGLKVHPHGQSRPFPFV